MSCLPLLTGDWGTGHSWQSLRACYVPYTASELKESKEEKAKHGTLRRQRQESDEFEVNLGLHRETLSQK